jgi:hypothetical protein
VSGTLIAIGVVCLAIGIVTNLVMAETDKPATGGPFSPSRAVRRHLGNRSTAVLEPAVAEQEVVEIPEVEHHGREPETAEARAQIDLPPRGEPDVPMRWWQRARSASVLLAILVVIGLLAAALVGALAVAVVQLVRDAVG